MNNFKNKLVQKKKEYMTKPKENLREMKGSFILLFSGEDRKRGKKKESESKLYKRGKPKTV